MLGDRLTTTVTTTATNIDLNADGHSVLVDLNIASSWDGTVDFQATIDGSNYFNVPYLALGTITPAASVAQLTSLSTARYLLPGPLTQVRLNCAAGSTGTLTAIYRVVPNNGSDGTAVAMVQSSGSDARSADDDRMEVESSLYGYAPDGSWDRLRTIGDTAGQGLGVLAVSPAAHKYVSRNDQSGAGLDFQVKSGAGFLHTITLGEQASTGRLTVYDSLTETGTIIAQIYVGTENVPATLTFDVAFATGLYIGADSGASADLSISYT